MSYTIPPLLKAILAEADRIAPGRSHASDGTIGDLSHQQQGGSSDHNPDSRGIVHAVDITHDPAHGFDRWQQAQRIASRIAAGTERRVKYLVTSDGQVDRIFNPSVSMTWRVNGSPKNDHLSHLHISILSGSDVENSTAPIFGSAPGPPPPAPKGKMLMFLIGDPRNTNVYITDGAKSTRKLGSDDELFKYGILLERNGLSKAVERSFSAAYIDALLAAAK